MRVFRILYVDNILAFFTISDGLVIDNLVGNFQSEVDILEAQFYYGLQTLVEQIHTNGYSLLIEAYIKNERKKIDLFNSMETNAAVAAKAAWAQDWIEHPSFAHRLVAFACVEGIAFSSLFAGVFYFRSRNKMPGLCAMNEFIIKDETSHYEFALNLYKEYLKDEFKLPKEELRKIILSCCDAEIAFVDASMPDGLSGLTKEQMKTYVKFVTDIVLNDYGCDVEFNVRNPLDYMARIGLGVKNNFFEHRTGEYTRVVVPNTLEGIYDDEEF